MTMPYLKGAANTHIAFLQKHRTLNLQWWKLWLKHHTCYVLHYFKFSPLLADILADIFLNIVSDILSQTFSLNFFQTYLLTFLTYFWPFFLTSFLRRSFWTSFRHIFWHSFWLILWHLATTSLRHSFCNYYQSFRSRLRSGTPHWTHRIAVGVRHATLNSQDRGWGPARHTELAGSRLRSGTPHWTHRIAVGVRHATLNSRARGWGPARHTELTSSRLRSGTPHCTHKIVVEVRRGGGRGGGGQGGRGGGGEETDIKSTPDRWGTEKSNCQLSSIVSWWLWVPICTEVPPIVHPMEAYKNP